MAEEWIVRVGEKEYGPVDYAALLEWKREGRLLAQNEVRPDDSGEWIKAAAVPGLFTPPPLPPKVASEIRRRSFSQIITDSFRVYRRNVVAFLVLSLLVSVPFFALELATQPAYGIFSAAPSNTGLTRANLVLLFAIVTLLIDWPLFLAGIQFASRDSLDGHKTKLRELFRRAVNYFPRFARLSLIVYGNFFFCIAIPLLVILTLVSNPSLPALFLVLLFLCLQVVWFSYLWANYLFWQQSAGLSNLDGIQALRESRLLARSKRRTRWQDRPLWRGALFLSLWVVIWLAISVAAELPVIYLKMRNITSLEEASALFKQLQSVTAFDPIMFWSGVIGAVVQFLLRPLLGIAFVLLYYDARTDFSEAELAPPDQNPG